MILNFSRILNFSKYFLTAIIVIFSFNSSFAMAPVDDRVDPDLRRALMLSAAEYRMQEMRRQRPGHRYSSRRGRGSRVEPVVFVDEDEELARALEESARDFEKREREEARELELERQRIKEEAVRRRVAIRRRAEARSLTFQIRNIGRERGFYKLETDLMVVIQLPVIQQKESTCGSCACINACNLGVIKSVDSARCAVNFVDNILSGSRAVTAIRRNAAQLRKDRFLRLDHVIDHQLDPEEYAANLDHNMMSLEEMRDFVADLGIEAIVLSRGGDPLAGQSLLERKVREFVVSENPDPVVLVVNTAMHWIVVRIERMPDGKIGILLADSAWNAEDDIVNKIDFYEDSYRLFSHLSNKFLDR